VCVIKHEVETDNRCYHHAHTSGEGGGGGVGGGGEPVGGEVQPGAVRPLSNSQRLHKVVLELLDTERQYIRVRSPRHVIFKILVLLLSIVQCIFKVCFQFIHLQHYY